MGEVVRGNKKSEGDPVSDGIRTECDWTTTDPSIAIIKAIATIEGTDPIAVSGSDGLILQEYVDVDALDSLLGDDRMNVSDITIEIEGYTVQISGAELSVVPSRDRLG